MIKRALADIAGLKQMRPGPRTGELTSSTARRAPARAFVASLALVVPLLAAAAPASAGVAINEVQSEGSADFIELVNVDAVPMDIGGYVIKDSNNGNSFPVPVGTSIPANGYYVAVRRYGRLWPGRGRLGTAVRTRQPGRGGQLLVGLARGRDLRPLPRRHRPDDRDQQLDPWRGERLFGSGRRGRLAGKQRGLDRRRRRVFGSNLSGLAYQPSGSGAPGVLWAVRNGPSTLFRLIYDGTKWTPDTANGWSNGKQLLYPNGTGVPDAEGVTLAGGDPNGIYVATERNDVPGRTPSVAPRCCASTSRPRPATLVATKDWNLSPDATLPVLDSNAGLEAVTWVPDELLVAKGFLDEATGAKYNPAIYPDHGAGLFFVGVEQDAKIIAYALNQTTGAFTRVATIKSGFPKIMELQYEPESTHLWAVCDDTCNGRTATLDIAQTGPNAGRFVVTKTYERPAGMPNLNNEGFAIAPQAECVNGLKPVFWSDDTNAAPHALRAGKLNCTVPTTRPRPRPRTPRRRRRRRAVACGADAHPAAAGDRSHRTGAQDRAQVHQVRHLRRPSHREVPRDDHPRGAGGPDHHHHRSQERPDPGPHDSPDNAPRRRRGQAHADAEPDAQRSRGAAQGGDGDADDRGARRRPERHDPPRHGEGAVAPQTCSGSPLLVASRGRVRVDQRQQVLDAHDPVPQRGQEGVRLGQHVLALESLRTAADLGPVCFEHPLLPLGQISGDDMLAPDAALSALLPDSGLERVHQLVLERADRPGRAERAEAQRPPAAWPPDHASHDAQAGHHDGEEHRRRGGVGPRCHHRDEDTA